MLLDSGGYKKTNQGQWMLGHMRKYSILFLNLLLVVIVLLNIGGCSVLVSKPRIAKIRIQGLDNKYHECFVSLSGISSENDLDIQISKNYAVQIDFEWLWDSDTNTYLGPEKPQDEASPSLTPWMMCKYRF
jgi:hypothetical protein